ncbi:hypothetical protein [Thermococcus sp.]
MRAIHILVVMLVLMEILVSGCLSNTVPTHTMENTSSTFGEQRMNETSSMTASVGTAEINGTFSGYLTAPMDVFDEVERFLNSMNITLYAFTAEVSGGKTNASITVYVLKLSPSFVPRDFNITINGRRINGMTCVPYSKNMSLSIWKSGRNGYVKTESYLTVHPTSTTKATARTSVEVLNNVTEKTLLRLNDMSFIVKVVKPNDYLFTVLCNGTEVSSGGLDVD